MEVQQLTFCCSGCNGIEKTHNSDCNTYLKIPLPQNRPNIQELEISVCKCPSPNCSRCKKWNGFTWLDKCCASCDSTKNIYQVHTDDCCINTFVPDAYMCNNYNCGRTKGLFFNSTTKTIEVLQYCCESCASTVDNKTAISHSKECNEPLSISRLLSHITQTDIKEPILLNPKKCKNKVININETYICNRKAQWSNTGWLPYCCTLCSNTTYTQKHDHTEQCNML